MLSGGPWLKLQQLNQSPHKGWGRRMGNYKPGGSGHSTCWGMQQLQTNNHRKRVVNLMQNGFFGRKPKATCNNSIYSTDRKGGNVELFQCFQINICSLPGNTNTFRFKILNKKICWTSALFQKCPKLKKKKMGYKPKMKQSDPPQLKLEA